VGLALVAATQRLGSAGLDSPRLDAEVLLAQVLGCGRAQLYAYPERALSDGERIRFEQLVNRRFRHEPVAYLVGRKAFYGLDLAVNHSVLIPRPETELLVDMALDLLVQADRLRALAAGGNGDGAMTSLAPVVVADVGTGSGAIALAIAANTEAVVVYGTDVSAAALAMARSNAEHHSLADRITFLKGNLLEPLNQPVDLIVANLPYVATYEWDDLEPDITQFEPSLALSGGLDGLDVIRELLRQAPGRLRPQGALLLEIGANQGAKVARLAREAFPEAMVEVLSDYAYRDRVVRIQT
jgi:release factor glutamine methyltransferase